jgi:hypothetical protein
VKYLQWLSLAVKQLCHHAGSTAFYGCRLCKTIGQHRENTRNGMYFPDGSDDIRPLIDYVEGNEVSVINQKKMNLIN